jgi:hypothetical protein
MDELTYKTWRSRRNVFERLRGYDRIYETKITDGERTAYGRGPTRGDSLTDAERNWLKQVSQSEAT